MFEVESVGQEGFLVDPDSASKFLSNLKTVSGDSQFLDTVRAGSETLSDEFWFSSDDYRAQYRPYEVSGRTLVVPVFGSLLNHFPWSYRRSATGYEYIERAIDRGMDDPDVDRVLLHVDSPGGVAAGLFDLADRIYARRSDKPIWAYCDDHAFSAAYALASSAEKVQTTRSGMTGSVGVLLAHYDVSKLMNNLGIEVTFIFAGKQKTEGNPLEPLGEDAKARFQARVDKLYVDFISTVSRNRGMARDDVEATEAGVFDSEEGQSVGFSDGVISARDILTRFEGERTMAGKTELEIKDDAKSVVATEGKPEGAVSEASKKDNSTFSEKDVRAEERARASTVMASELFPGREALASKLLQTEMSADDILEAMAETPTKSTKSENHFVSAMDAEGSPAIGEDGGTDDEVTQASDHTARIVAASRMAQGLPVKHTSEES